MRQEVSYNNDKLELRPVPCITLQGFSLYQSSLQSNTLKTQS